MKKQFLIGLMTSIFISSIYAQDIPTRFGKLTINDENILLYKNKSFNPEIQGNSSLSHLGTYALGTKDIVLIQDNGGTGCPALLYLITLSESKVKASQPFGTCSDLIKVKATDKNVLVTMTGFQGPFESEKAQEKAAREKHLYSFNGEKIKHSQIKGK